MEAERGGVPTGETIIGLGLKEGRGGGIGGEGQSGGGVEPFLKEGSVPE